MNGTAPRETKCRQAVLKLITSLNSKRYRPSYILIHGNICKRLATICAPVEVRRRAVEPAHKVKNISLYLGRWKGQLSSSFARFELVSQFHLKT